MSAPALKLVDPATGELVDPASIDHRIRDLEDRCDGYKQTIDAQARKIGVLNRQIEIQEDPNTATNSEAAAVVLHWKRACGKPTAKVGANRLKLVRARFRDGFDAGEPDDLPPEPTLLLAIDGLASHPYEVFGKRYRDGKKSNLKNDLKDALGDEAKVEACARLGFKARRAGWTLEDGWPTTEEER